MVGFLGPNGAGSTTLRILSGLIPADSGEAKVCGVDLAEEEGEVRQHIGFWQKQPITRRSSCYRILKFPGKP